MRIAISIPGESELELAYSRLLYERPAPPDEEAIALYSQWSRFDPRLGEILVGHLTKHWERYHPLKLRSHLLKHPWPEALGLILEFVKETFKDKLFDGWRRLTLQGIPKARGELFFFGLRALGGDLMEEDAAFPLKPYQKWGYLARENLADAKKAGHHSPETRRQILSALISKRSRIRTRDYINALGGCISARQAERDLKGDRRLRATGRSKGVVFVVRQ